MDQATLAMFMSALLEFFKPKLPAWAYALLKSGLDRLLSTHAAPALVGVAPDALKAWVKALLLEWAAKATSIPFVNNVLTRVITLVDGAILDYLWDLAQAQLAGQPNLLKTAKPPALAAVVLDDLVTAHAA